MQKTLPEEISRLLTDNMMIDLRSKFGFSVPKDVVRPLILRADSAVVAALSELPHEQVYACVDHYEVERELFIDDVVMLTGEPRERVVLKLDKVVREICDKLQYFIKTWHRVQARNAAYGVHSRPGTQEQTHDTRQARNHRSQRFTR